MLSLVIVALASGAAAFGSLCNPKATAPHVDVSAFPAQTMPPNFRVVLAGDQGLLPRAGDVLGDIKAFDPHLFVHLGDFDYVSSPQRWDEMVSGALGDRFPMFSLIGNHDDLAWSRPNGGYQGRLWERYEKVKEDYGDNLHCQGYTPESEEEDIGIFFVCKFFDFLFVTSGVGQRGDREAHYAFIDEALDVPAPWKLTAVHKNMRDYQTGNKGDDIGYDTMEIARAHGAFLLHGHEHSYARTHLMANFEDKAIASRNATLELSPGQSFSVVSGLAGIDIRGWESDREMNAWWAATASEDGACSTSPDGVYSCDRSVATNVGALYCTLNIDGQADRGSCFFKDVDGIVWDRFDVISDTHAASKIDARSGLCTKRMVDFVVQGSADDAFENLETGTVDMDADVLEMSPTTLAGVRFPNVDLPKDARIHSALINFAGAVDGEGDTSILIRAELGASREFAPVANDISARRFSSAAALWENDDMSSWEEYSIWASADVTDLVLEALADPERAHSGALVFSLATKGASRLAHSIDKQPCAAPTLVIQLEKDC